MDATGRRRNLVVAAAAAAAVAAAAYDLKIWIEGYLADNFHNDVTFYVAAARVGLSHGWSKLYDLNLQQEQLAAIGSAIHVAQLARYVSPPPLAWLMVPLTPLPFRLIYWVWSLLLLIALGLTWKLAAPGQGRVRLILLAAAIGWLPVIYGLTLGQPVLFVAAGVAGCYALVLRDRQLAAGTAITLLVLKPQVAFLVPPALLVTGRWRAFSAAAAVLAALAILSALALGTDGVAVYEQRLTFASTVLQNQSQTLASLIGNVPATRIAQFMVALWTLGLAYKLRNRGVGLTLAVALVGGCAATPYIHYGDLTMLGLAGWLYLRSSNQRWGWAYVLALAIAAEGFPIWGAGPILIGELGALALLTVFPQAEAIDHLSTEGAVATHQQA
jgi:alpha-1,2-mannosyltransferase